MKVKKIIISLSIIILTAIIGTGVYTMISGRTDKEVPKKSWSEKISEMPNYWIKKNSLMNDFDQQYNKSEDELTIYDFSSFRTNYGVRHFVIPETSSDIKWLQAFNDVYPIELIKKIDRDHICVVYKFSNAEIDDMLTYIVFERQTSFLTKKDGVEKAGFYECWNKTGELYYLTEKFSSADFENIKVGDSALNVYNIEPTISVDKEFFSLDDSNINFKSYRLLYDGVMVIEFKAPRDTEKQELPMLSEYTVSSKTLYPYNSDAVKEIQVAVNAPDILR